MSKLVRGDAVEAEDEVRLLTEILNGAWGRFFPVTPSILRRRLLSGHLFVVVRDQPSPEERAYIRSTYDIEGTGDIPIGILETIDAVTGGDARRIPPTYADLTSGGSWRPPLPGADTQVFVDLTTATSRRQSGIGRDIVQFALENRSRHHRFTFTFTPNQQPIIDWHIRRGARHSGVVLAGARPGHTTPDVAVMDYSASRPGAAA